MTTNNVPTDADLLGCAGVSRLHGNTPAIFGTADIRRFAECVSKNWGQPAMPADAIANAMRDVADRYAHRMAMSLECILLDYSGKWYDEAALILGAYRSAMNAIHEIESPTHMGEPVIARRRIEGEGK